MTTDLVAFLRERVNEDAQAAGEVSSTASTGHYPWALARVGDDYGDEVLGIDPVRALAEVEVKRAMLRYYAQACTAASGLVDADEIGGRVAVEFFWSATLRLLVQPYATHPDFDPAWSVSAGVR